MGRPPIPKREHKASLLSVRFSKEERRILEKAAFRKGLVLSAWARHSLLDAASFALDTPPAPPSSPPSLDHPPVEDEARRESDAAPLL